MRLSLIIDLIALLTAAAAALNLIYHPQHRINNAPQHWLYLDTALD